VNILSSVNPTADDVVNDESATNPNKETVFSFLRFTKPADGMVCRPPESWYSFYGGAMMGRLTKASGNLYDLRLVPFAKANPGANRFNIKDLFVDTSQAIFYFVTLSLVIYLTAYATGRYYGGLVRGRCGNDKQCAARMMRVSAHVQDSNRGSSKTMWNPLSSGTLGWVIAQSLLGMSFL
jgi:hypothetical protein